MDLAALLAKVGEAAPMPSVEVRPPNRYLVAHVDGDYMAYFAAGSDDCSAGEARRNVLSRLSKLRTVSGCGKIIVHLTHGASTKGDRFLVAQERPYQAQRKGSRKPKQWEFLRSWMETYEGAEFNTKIWNTREADDGMAHVCTQAAIHQKLLHVVHTRDKDMRMFCGLHVNWMDWSITEVPHGAYDIIGEDGEQYGHKWFWMQMLQGDGADNIPGLAGVGPETASIALAGTTDNAGAASVVRGMYAQRRGTGWEDYFVEQAVLLWMRTDQQATTRNFLELDVFGDSVKAAVMRMETRVRAERQRLKELQA